ncbi:hypothetical protein PG990_014846 [Apiospora arundinis]
MLQALNTDILWIVAHSFLDTPYDVFNVARTCRDHWKLLEPEIYRTDILFCKERQKAEDRRTNAFLVQNGRKPRNPDIPDSPGIPSDAVRQLLPEDDDMELYYNRSLSAPRWRPLTIIQWAAATGAVATAEKAIKVAKRIWPKYIIHRHIDSGNCAIHFAAWYGNTDILRLVAEAHKDNPGTTMNMVSGLLFDADYERDDLCNVYYLLSEIFHEINPSPGYIPSEIAIRPNLHPFSLTAIGIAILRGHEEMAKYLVDAFYDDKRIVEFDEIGLPRTDTDFKPSLHPLHLACFMGMHELVTSILDKGADVNAKFMQPYNSTPLMWAAAAGPDNGRIIDCLLARGADITSQDLWSRNAVAWAVLFKAPKNASRLILAGPEVPIDTPIQNIDDITVHESVLWPCMVDDIFLDCTKLMLQTHPDFPEGQLKRCVQKAFYEHEHNEKTLQWIAEHDVGLGPVTKEDLEDPDDFVERYKTRDILGASALHYAAVDPNLPCSLLAKILEKRPQDVNLATNRIGYTALSLAIGSSGPRSEKVALLLAHGADPESCNTEATCAVSNAIKYGRPDHEVDKAITNYETQTLGLKWTEKHKRKDVDKMARLSGNTDEHIQQLWERNVRYSIVKRFHDNGVGMNDVVSMAGRLDGYDLRLECWRLHDKAFQKEQTERKVDEGLHWIERERRRQESMRRHMLGA